MSSIQLESQSGRRGLRIVMGRWEREFEMVSCQPGDVERMLPERKRTGWEKMDAGGRGEGAWIMVASRGDGNDEAILGDEV